MFNYISCGVGDCGYDGARNVIVTGTFCAEGAMHVDWAVVLVGSWFCAFDHSAMSLHLFLFYKEVSDLFNVSIGARRLTEASLVHLVMQYLSCSDGISGPMVFDLKCSKGYHEAYGCWKLHFGLGLIS